MGKCQGSKFLTVSKWIGICITLCGTTAYVCILRLRDNPDPVQSDPECYSKNKDYSYRGTRNTTLRGYHCMKWTAGFPHKPDKWIMLLANDVGWSDFRGLGDHNFCRSIGDTVRPWCYTTNSTVKWEFCDIPACASEYHPIPISRKRIPSCPLPRLSSQLRQTSWYPLWEKQVNAVNLENCPEGGERLCCSRWWHDSPQSEYYSKLAKPYTPKPDVPLRTRAECSFQNKERGYSSECGMRLETVFGELDKLGVVWFIQDGTEMGAVRKSSLMSADEDIDIFVNLPSINDLIEKFESKTDFQLTLKFHNTSTFWNLEGKKKRGGPINVGCSRLHIYVLDWMLREMKMQPLFQDTCTCYIDSIPVSCHKNAEKRLFIEFGPTWKIPIPIKNLENPLWLIDNAVVRRTNHAREILKSLAPTTGVIDAKTIRAIDPSIEIQEDEMPFILAHLNVVKDLINDTLVYKRKVI